MVRENEIQRLEIQSMAQICFRFDCFQTKRSPSFFNSTAINSASNRLSSRRRMLRGAFTAYACWHS